MTNVETSLDIPTDFEARRAWVVFQLRLRGTSFSAIGRAMSVTAQAVAMTMLVPSARMEAAIAEALGLSPQKLFPERYDEGGIRRLRTRGRNLKIKRMEAPRIAKKGKAA
jgi:Ner family transcriptional regulator